jgi:A-macroglobulin TED domain/Alpha-2-macroglobulin family/MG2 domain/Carboxypeptidase regulatory-like domain/A-macroglobulin receptor binding domain/Alpha-2-macroglobulin bait region domain
MTATQAHRSSQNKCFYFILVLLILAAAGMMRPGSTSDGETLVATYRHGSLHVVIPYHARQAGPGKLRVEILDPEDKVVAAAEQSAQANQGKGQWQQEVRLEKPLPLEDLVWHRVRYRFEYQGGQSAALEDTESISQILRTPIVRIIGQQEYLTGGKAAVRVIVSDSKTEVISGSGTLRIELLYPNQKPRALFRGKVNEHGTTEAQFRLPASLVGSYQLHYIVDTSIGSTEFTQPVRLEDKVSILLTTEKPIYQPGQTIHIRALALDRSDREASAARKLTFEVEDSRGNKVFKKLTQTDEFGIASAQFALADEVNLGTYHLRALMGSPGSDPTNQAEMALSVEKYVLPKFKVAIDLAGEGNKKKRGYQPGDLVTGTVRANYFFGKAVEDGEVTIKGASTDVSVFEIATVQGRTDTEGVYHFNFRLPRYFAGHPLSQGAARVLIQATVKDSAGHSETRGEPITVAESPIIITAVPEGGTLIPNLDNEVFVLTSYPDGVPAVAELRVQASGGPEQHAKTDAEGVAMVHLHADSGSAQLEVEARDTDGNQATGTIPLQTRDGADQVLLRTERAVYGIGDPIRLRVFSTRKRGTVYLDVVREGQTVLTRDVDIENGQAGLTLTATPDMTGTLDLNAYIFGRDAQPVGDHRLVFIQPVDELKIAAVADARSYKPGEEARVRFRVTNSKGEAVHAALGLQVVDEAALAWVEKQPGFAKVFFYLEQEAMKPRYEIHSLGMPEILGSDADRETEQKDRDARALFAATEMVTTNNFETEFGRTIPSTKYADYANRYHSQLLVQVKRLAEKLGRAYTQSPGEGDFTTVVRKLTRDQAPELRDAWSTNLHIEPAPWYSQGSYYVVRSAGPDKQFDTGDDLVAYLEVHRRKMVGHPSIGPSSIAVEIEHDRGPISSRGEVVGTVVDQWGAALEGATVILRDLTTSSRRIARADSRGNFALRGLPAANYEVVVSTGAESISQAILTIAARDRAVLSVHLRTSTPETVVAVNESARAVAEFKVGAVGTGAGGFRRDLPMVEREFMVMAAKDDRGQVAGMATTQSVAVDAAAPPPAAPVPLNSATIAKKESNSEAPRVRSYFPEALYINPAIITDHDGAASVAIPLADSITTWRMSTLASTAQGALGSATSSLKVFQDFFVDLDLPVTLTQGDRVSIPVAVYNYSGSRGDVNLKLEADRWYALADDVPEKTVAVDSGRVGGSQFTLQANHIGKFKLTLLARMQGGNERADVVVREIEVVPNGREQTQVFNGRLETRVSHQVDFPSDSIPDATKIFVRLYPGPLSQVIEGMDGILRMPGGCFEQTSSSTYPNVLALDYMKRTKKLMPEVHAKAEGYIANGYQRLLTFEVPGGGFSWFGNPPANKILTAYGLMEFHDMSKVNEVDPSLIQRTQQWLSSQQQADGSWKPDTSFINEGATNRYNSDVLRITAYIAWSLENTSYQGPAVENAKRFVEKRVSGKMDAYTLAVLANFAADYGKDEEFAREVMQRLLEARTEKGEQVWWSAEETAVYSTGESASVETTGLAVQALLKWGGASETARKALAYIASKKDSSGTWGTTQATIMALRALLLATEKGSADVQGTVIVALNGKPRERLVLTPENNDLLHQFVFKDLDAKGSNTVEIQFEGKGGLAYQVVGDYYLPWDAEPANEPLSIDLTYDRSLLAQDDIATATATIRNNLPKSANMVMVDLGVPPGFDLLSEDLQDYQEKSSGLKSGRLEKFSMTATQAILYFDSFAPGETVKLHYRLRAKYPIRAHTFQSRVYEYYDPQVSSVARPIQLEVTPR